MKNKNLSKKISLCGVLIAVGVVLGSFYIPVFGAKMSPVQHFINVIAAVLLGPIYSVGCAFSISFIRNIIGTGSLLAFPGSMVGALLSAIIYKKMKSIEGAAIGEFIGTGIIGAIIAYPIAALVLGKEVALFFYVVPFSISSFGGSLFAYITLKLPGIKKLLLNGEI